MTAPERRAADLDLDAIEQRWLISCPSCDGGLAMDCECPREDHRNVIEDLVAAVRTERRLREQAEAEAERKTGVIRRFQYAEAKARAQRDSARAELARLREAVDRVTKLADNLASGPSVGFLRQLTANRLRAALSDAGQPHADKQDDK